MLAPALDRFAQFFVAPLFDPAYVEREANAVDSEYRLGLKDDGRREYDVLRELVRPDHPLAKLGVGNLQTLDVARGGLRADLLALLVVTAVLSLGHPAVLGWHLGFPIPAPALIYLPYFAALFQAVLCGLALLLCLV